MALTFAAERKKWFWTDHHYAKVGAGGITFLKDSVFSTGRTSETDRNLTLTADQAWRGMDVEGASRPVLSVGHPFYSTYYKMGLGVAVGVHSLTIEKVLDQGDRDHGFRPFPDEPVFLLQSSCQK